ncbi:hypothetical protein [Psychrobacillus sp.]|uniref:hypothetical protein n=1 Tax=Psychrobacillus sp. TaxID=1871623 RepID=UPI0028BEAACA|nr:hypothetical protein [Psychrobacillus sp.]
MTIEIVPTKEQVNTWINAFVPDKDLFFIEETQLMGFEDYLKEVLVMPTEEFFNHSSYNQIQLVNSYEYWNISSKANYIIVAPASWLTNLPVEKRKELLTIQVKVGRGLIFSSSLFSSAIGIPKEYIVVENEEEFVVIQYNMWNNLPYTIKENVMKAYAALWDNWTCCKVPEQTPLHIRKYANQFSIVSGSNCLSATLFAVTVQDWIISEWVHPKTFKSGLERANYFFINDEIMEGDVIVWIDTNEVIQHASYHIGDNLFFNKNGQTFFNPWKVTHWDEIKDKWNQYDMQVYRKKERDS